MSKQILSEEFEHLDLGNGLMHCPMCGLGYRGEPATSGSPLYEPICPECTTRQAVKAFEAFINRKPSRTCQCLKFQS